MYSVTTGGTDKTTTDKTFQTKDPLTKPPGTKTPANNWERICTGGFCPGFFVLYLRKIGGSEMCDVLWGGPGM